MNVLTFFTENGAPKTGLSPTLDIYELDGTQVAAATAMTEVAGGFYKFNFLGYDDTKDYVMVADGTSTLQASERYKFSTNETADTGTILKFEKNRWKIESNQLKVYDDDGSTVIKTFDLKDSAGSGSMQDVFERVPA